ncbi:MAG: hypothetical protein LH650_03195 [Chloroflexi bacterium]|nr:hypothetical protein [Chloroflexota bacterium]
MKINISDGKIAISGFDCCPVAIRTTTKDGSGPYSKDLSRTFNIAGFDQIAVTRTSPEGQTWTRTQRVPYLSAVVGKKEEYGAVDARQITTGRRMSADLASGAQINAPSMTTTARISRPRVTSSKAP